MIIVDAYCHIGECRVYDLSVAEGDIVEALTSNRVSAVILQPFPGAPNPALVHDMIAELGSRYPGRVFGLANCNPHINRDTYYQEVERCVHQLGFIGITMDTAGFAVNPNGQDAKTVFEAGRELSVPVVIHTGTGAPFGLPAAVLPRAREYSDVKIVLAHAGAGLYTMEAYAVARECANVYLETSWCRTDDIKWLIDELGASRIMFGSDLVMNQEAELAKYRSLGLYQFQQYQVFGQTAIDVFGLQGVPDLTEIVEITEDTEAAAATETVEATQTTEASEMVEVTETSEGTGANSETKTEEKEVTEN